MGYNDKKKEEQIKELQDFIARFSANASKSKTFTPSIVFVNPSTNKISFPTSRSGLNPTYG